MSDDNQANQPAAFSLQALEKKEVLTREVEFTDGIFLKLNYVPRSQFNKISKEATVLKFDDKIRARTPQVDNDKLIEAFSRRAISGWRGLTIKKASKLVPLNLSSVPKEQLDTEIAYSQEQAAYLMKNCAEFDTFVNSSVLALSTFDENHEDEVKN